MYIANIRWFCVYFNSIYYWYLKIIIGMWKLLLADNYYWHGKIIIGMGKLLLACENSVYY